MSILTYLACGVPLPTGDFITAPSYIYNDYAQYKQSKNFIDIELNNIFVAPPYNFSPKLHESGCPVHFYNDDSEIHFISIKEYSADNPPTRYLPDAGNFEVPKEIQAKFLLEQDVTKQFTLPYIYYLGIQSSEFALRQLSALI